MHSTQRGMGAWSQTSYSGALQISGNYPLYQFVSKVWTSNVHSIWFSGNYAIGLGIRSSFGRVSAPISKPCWNKYRQSETLNRQLFSEWWNTTQAIFWNYQNVWKSFDISATKVLHRLHSFLYRTTGNIWHTPIK